MRKTQILINKSVYLGLSVLGLNKAVIKQYVKAKTLLHGTDSFIVHVKTEYIYKNIAEDVKTRFYTSILK